MAARLQTIVAAMGIFLLPFLVWPGVDQDATFKDVKLWGCFLLGNIAFAFLLAKRLHWSLGIMHLAGALSILKNWQSADGLYPFLYWLAAVGFALWFLSIESKNQRTILLALIAAATLASVQALSQMAGYDPILTYAPGIESRFPIAMFRQRTVLASFLAPVACLSFAMGLWIPFAMLSLMTLLTHSLFAIAGLIAGLLVATRNLAILAVGGALTIVGLAATKLEGIDIDRGRYLVWEAAIKAWWNSDNRFFGFGIGAFYDNFAHQFQPHETYGSGGFRQAHNDFINLLFDGGLLLVVPVVAVCLLAGRKIYLGASAGAAAALTCLFVNAQGSYPMQLAPQYFIAVLCLAVVLRGGAIEAQS